MPMSAVRRVPAKRNPIARTLRDGSLRKRMVKPRRGRGSYSRTDRSKEKRGE